MVCVYVFIYFYYLSILFLYLKNFFSDFVFYHFFIEVGCVHICF